MKKFFRSAIIFALLAIILFVLAKECINHKNLSFLNDEEYVQDTSRLVIPVQIDIVSFENEFNRQMEDPVWFYEENDIKINRQISLSYRVRKDGKAQLYPQNEKIFLKLPLFIDIKPKINSSYSLGLGRNMNLQSKVELSSEIETSIQEDWQLFADAETDFEVLESPELNVLGIEIQFEKELINSLEMALDEINQQIEEQISKAVDTRKIVELIWTELEEPYEFTEKPFEAWASFRPMSINVTSLKPSKPGVMETTFEVLSMLDIETRKKNHDIGKIPKAILIERVENRSSVLHFPLSINIETFVNYLNEQDSFKIPIQENRELELSHFSAENDLGGLKINADFQSGEMKGKLEILGRPAIDAKNQRIYLENINIRSKSNKKMFDKLFRSAQRSNSVRNMLEKHISYSVEQDLANLTFTITNQIKKTKFNDYVRMSGYLNHIRLNDVFLDNDSIILDTEIEAGFVCEVKGN